MVESFQKKGSSEPRPKVYYDGAGDEWARELYTTALRCKEQDGEDEPLDELIIVAGKLHYAAVAGDGRWRL